MRNQIKILIQFQQGFQKEKDKENKKETQSENLIKILMLVKNILTRVC